MNAQGWFPTLICDFESQTHEQFKTSFYNKLEKYVHPDGIDGEHADLTFITQNLTSYSAKFLVSLNNILLH